MAYTPLCINLSVPSAANAFLYYTIQILLLLSTQVYVHSGQAHNQSMSRHVADSRLAGQVHFGTHRLYTPFLSSSTSAAKGKMRDPVPLLIARCAMCNLINPGAFSPPQNGERGTGPQLSTHRPGASEQL